MASSILADRRQPSRFFSSIFADRAIACSWIFVFLYTSVVRDNFNLPKTESYLLLVVLGMIHVRYFGLKIFKEIIQDFRALWIAVIALELGILLCETFATLSGGRGLSFSNLYWVGLLPCAPVLGYFLAQKTPRNFFFTLVGFLVVWHFFAMPIEAFFGKKITWHQKIIQYGGFKYQASGLAITRVFFVGLFLPMFYLVLGPVYEISRNITRPWRAALGSILAVYWIFISMCSGSREGFLASCAASYLFIFFQYPNRLHRILFFIVPTLTIALFKNAHIFTGQLLTAYETAAITRTENFLGYLREVLKWPSYLTGHGSAFPRETIGLVLPKYLTHAHNDLIENAFRWGLINLATYIGVWYFLFRLVHKKFIQKGRHWPLSVLVAFIPSLVVESGFSQFEKASFFIMLIGVLTGLGSKDHPLTTCGQSEY